MSKWVFSIAAWSGVAVVLSLLFSANCLALASETVLRTFTDGQGGALPYAGVVSDAAGNLYGTTQVGGAYGYGVVFKLARSSSGHWIETLLHSFNASDGRGPGALAIDARGNIFGVAPQGGILNCTLGCGTVFELSRAAGVWKFSLVHSFAGFSDGAGPAAIAVDSLSHIYVTTTSGGSISHLLCVQSNGCGTVVEFTQAKKSGTWRASRLHAFTYVDGAFPDSAVILDSAGNLYGSTPCGGADNNGLVFELSKSSGGQWTETILYTFTGLSDGGAPRNALVFDASGNLYGNGLTGAHNYGFVFELKPLSGMWTERVLYSFTGGVDGGQPNGPMIFDAAGNLYGTLAYGGNPSYAGSIFKLSPVSGGWAESVAYSFTEKADGGSPIGAMTLDKAGNLYGTTNLGGDLNACQDGCGTVFSLSTIGVD